MAQEIDTTDQGWLDTCRRLVRMRVNMMRSGIYVNEAINADATVTGDKLERHLDAIPDDAMMLLSLHSEVTRQCQRLWRKHLKAGGAPEFEPTMLPTR